MWVDGKFRVLKAESAVGMRSQLPGPAQLEVWCAPLELGKAGIG